MTEPITDAEIAALFSTDHKLLARGLKTVADESLSTKSTEGGTQKLAIPADPFQVAGSDQECRSILVVHSSDNAVYMNIGAVATADNWLIPKDTPIPLPFDNCSKLNFFGTQADVIRLLWRN